MICHRPSKTRSPWTVCSNCYQLRRRHNCPAQVLLQEGPPSPARCHQARRLIVNKNAGETRSCSGLPGWASEVSILVGALDTGCSGGGGPIGRGGGWNLPEPSSPPRGGWAGCSSGMFALARLTLPGSLVACSVAV